MYKHEPIGRMLNVSFIQYRTNIEGVMDSFPDCAAQGAQGCSAVCTLRHFSYIPFQLYISKLHSRKYKNIIRIDLRTWHSG